ncbi:hypothetical protein ACFQ4I_08285 [Methylorubrum suomiense]
MPFLEGFIDVCHPARRATTPIKEGPNLIGDRSDWSSPGAGRCGIAQFFRAMAIGDRPHGFTNRSVHCVSGPTT